MEKPFLTQDQKGNTMKWALQELERFAMSDFFCTFLDKKWFYTTKRCRKIKFVPPGQGENPEIFKKKQLKMISRRHH
eukprot:6998697-Ditylum_brightwellii.AAC.1